MVDEWRICGEEIITNKVAAEESLSYPEQVMNTTNKVPPPMRDSLNASNINIISEDDCFTVYPENTLEISRSKLRFDVPNQTPSPIILEATEVKPNIEEVKKE